jgi:hypothetical protein
MKNALAIAITAMAAMQLIADENDFRKAFLRWERNPCLVSALHVATSGLFLAEDIAALG